VRESRKEKEYREYEMKKSQEKNLGKIAALLVVVGGVVKVVDEQQRVG